MEVVNIIPAFNALGNATRFAAFRLLIQAGPQGLVAGELSARLGVVPNTLSNHLGILTTARLVTATRSGRFVCYAADLASFRDLMTWLTLNCCASRPKLCAPPLSETLFSHGGRDD